MGSGILKPTVIALQGLILVFSVSLIYFTFVYYPRVAGQIRLTVPFSNLFVDKVVAGGESFPVETTSYKITYERGSSLYYVFVQGSTLSQYVENKLAAQLALKNTLQADTLCDLNIIYSSVSRLEIPKEYTITSNCD